MFLQLRCSKSRSRAVKWLLGRFSPFSTINLKTKFPSAATIAFKKVEESLEEKKNVNLYNRSRPRTLLIQSHESTGLLRVTKNEKKS